MIESYSMKMKAFASGVSSPPGRRCKERESRRVGVRSGSALTRVSWRGSVFLARTARRWLSSQSLRADSGRLAATQWSHFSNSGAPETRYRIQNFVLRGLCGSWVCLAPHTSAAWSRTCYMVSLYLGFSFCLICPQCGGEANTWEVSMGMMSK